MTQPTTDPKKAAQAQLDAATQAAKIAAQQKDLADSELAILKDKFAVPDSGFTGEVKVGDKAGNIEATLLTAHAVQLAAHKIRTDLKKKAAVGPVMLFGGNDLPDFQALLTFEAQFQGVDRVLEEAVKEMDAAMNESGAILRIYTAPVAAAFDAANKLLGYFRTDYAVQGVTVASDDLLLVSAVAGALSGSGFNVRIPALYNPDAWGQSPVVTKLNEITDKRAKLQWFVEKVAKKSSESGQPLADGLKAAVDHAKTAIQLYDGFLAKLTTLDDKARVPLAVIVQQDAIRTPLTGDPKTMMLIVKVSSAGGTCYTKKNIWTALGKMPFFAMGGVVVSYSVYNGKTGEVTCAGAVPVGSGFYKVHELPKPLSMKDPFGFWELVDRIAQFWKKDMRADEYGDAMAMDGRATHFADGRVE